MDNESSNESRVDNKELPYWMKQRVERGKADFELIAKQPRVDVLVALGKGWNHLATEHEEIDQHWGLSKDAKLTAMASGLLWAAGKTEKIIFTGGQTSGDEVISEAEAMRRYVSTMFEGMIPDEVMVVEDKSADTIQNAKGVVGNLNDKTFAMRGNGERRNIGVVTVGYHSDRAIETFNKVLADELNGEAKDVYHVGEGKYIKETYASDKIVESFSNSLALVQGYKRRWEHLTFEQLRERLASAMLKSKTFSNLMTKAAEKKRK